MFKTLNSKRLSVDADNLFFSMKILLSCKRLKKY